MSKKLIEPDEMRMPADEFDAMMRRALDAPPPLDEQAEARKMPAKGPKARKREAVQRN